MAVAVELLHTASLVHDDTVDKAPLRRGRETINGVWGADVALLLGDYLFASAAEMVCSTGNVEVIRLFSRTLRDLADGELREIHRPFDWAQSEDRYWQRVEKKTSSLFATSAVSGAILGNAPPTAVAAIRAFGLALGTAFQVIDDILDFEGDETEVGKPVGNDLRQGVLTLPTMLYLREHAGEGRGVDALERLRSSGAQGEEDDSAVAAAVAEIRASGAIRDSYEVAADYATRARVALDRIGDGSNPVWRSLSEILDFVVARDR